MAVSLLIPPVVEPVSLQEAKDHLRLDTDAHDAMVQVQIQAAREHVEMFTRRQLVTATWLLTLPAFPPVVTFPYPPLHRVVTVQYLDPAGQLVLLPATSYTVRTDLEPGQVFPAPGGSWPATQGSAQAVQITFEAGYGATGAAVPARARQAILLLVGDFYEHAEAQAEGALTDNRTVGRLLWGFRAEVVS